MRGEPIPNKDGYHAVVSTDDELGRIASIAYEGLDGQPAPRPGHKNEYDAQGRIARQMYVTTAGTPANEDDGSYGWEAVHDQEGHEISHTWLGADGTPTLLAAGYAKVQRRFSQGTEVERAYFGTKGEPVLTKTGYHRWQRGPGEPEAGASHQHFDLEGRLVRTRRLLAVEAVAGGEAKRLGLRAGDVLCSYGGRTLMNNGPWPGLDAALDLVRAAFERARRPDLVIWRDGKRMTFALKPGATLGVGSFAEQDIAESVLVAAGLK